MEGAGEERLINSRHSWPHLPQRLSKHGHNVVFFVGRHMNAPAASSVLQMISQVYKLGFEFLNLVAQLSSRVDQHLSTADESVLKTLAPNC